MSDKVKLSSTQAAEIDSMLEAFDKGNISPVAVTPALVAIIAATAVATGAAMSSSKEDLEKLTKIRELLDSLDHKPSLDDLKKARASMVVDG